MKDLVAVYLHTEALSGTRFCSAWTSCHSNFCPKGGNILISPPVLKAFHFPEHSPGEIWNGSSSPSGSTSIQNHPSPETVPFPFPRVVAWWERYSLLMGIVSWISPLSWSHFTSQSILGRKYEVVLVPLLVVLVSKIIHHLKRFSSPFQGCPVVAKIFHPHPTLETNHFSIPNLQSKKVSHPFPLPPCLSFTPIKILFCCVVVIVNICHPTQEVPFLTRDNPCFCC